MGTCQSELDVSGTNLAMLQLRMIVFAEMAQSEKIGHGRENSAMHHSFV